MLGQAVIGQEVLQIVGEKPPRRDLPSGRHIRRQRGFLWLVVESHHPYRYEGDGEDLPQKVAGGLTLTGLQLAIIDVLSGSKWSTVAG